MDIRHQGSTGALILAGGRGRRMGGEDKALLTLGGESFLSHLTDILADFPEKLISVDRPGRFHVPGWNDVMDQFPDCGPLGGLVSALGVCKSEALLAIACDMPLITKELIAWMLARYDSGSDCQYVVGRDGRRHYLCGFYSKSALASMEKAIESGNYKVVACFEGLRISELRLENSPFPDELLSNVNRYEDYKKLLERRKS